MTTHTADSAKVADREQLLAHYDTHLRTESEMEAADRVERLGPLWFAKGPRGVTITHAPLGTLARDLSELPGLVRTAHERALSLDPSRLIEWKTRSHDDNALLVRELDTLGYRPGTEESVMMGHIPALLSELEKAPASGGFRVRRLEAGERAREDVTALLTALGASFGEDFSWLVDVYLERLTLPRVGYWLAEAEDGTPIGAGRAEWWPPGRAVALWGGGVVPEWRGRGVYRALLVARLRAAWELGMEVVHSDSSDMSAPIHARAGMVHVTTVVPWEWKVPGSPA